MAREPVVAVDFLGLGKTLRDRESEGEEKGKLVKPMASLPTPGEQGSGRILCGEGEKEACLQRYTLRVDNSHMSGPLAFSLSQSAPWGCVPGRGEDIDRGAGASRAAVDRFGDKSIEELSDLEIMQLTGEDCRRYMLRQKMKERVLPRPAPVPTMQQMHTMRSLVDPRQEEKGSVGGSLMRNALSDGHCLSKPSALVQLHDPTGPSDTSGGFQAPRYTLVSQQQSCLNDEILGGVCLADRSQLVEPSLSLSIPIAREPPAQCSGFGSPLPNTFLRMLKPPEQGLRPPQVLQPAQGGGSQVGVVPRSSTQSHLPGRPPTAQLTIFYSGMVNVYDDVPSDKAQAIMLLAGSGNSWSSTSMNPPLLVTSRPSSSVGIASSSNAAVPPPVPLPASAASQGATSLVASAPIPLGGLKAVPAARATLHAELPQARKASLARFLEKRKDRVRGKGPYVAPVSSPKKGGDTSTPPRDKSPGSGGVKIRARSPSPANLVSSLPPKRSPSPAPRPGQSRSAGSDTSSPTKQLMISQQTSQSSPSEDQVTPAVQQRLGKDEQTEWVGQQQPHHPQEQKPEPMEEGRGSSSQWR